MLDRWNEKPPWLAETKEWLQYPSQPEETQLGAVQYELSYQRRPFREWHAERLRNHAGVVCDAHGGLHLGLGSDCSQLGIWPGYHAGSDATPGAKAVVRRAHLRGARRVGLQGLPAASPCRALAVAND